MKLLQNLNVTGSMVLSGSTPNTIIGITSFTGNTTVTGSLAVSGSIVGTTNINGNTNITGSTYISSSNSTQLQVGSNSLFVSGSGIVGVGTTPSGWGSSWRPVQMGSYGVFITGRTDDNSMFLGNNVYYNGTNWIGTTTSFAQQMFFDGSGNMTFRNASVTAGAATGFNNIMVLNQNGRNGYIDTQGNTLYSFYTYSGGVSNGASVSLSISQVLYEYMSSYLYDIVGLYAPSGTNVRAFATGFAHFFSDGSTNDNNVSTSTSTGWSVSSNSNNSGAFNIVFTNNSGYSQNNINIRVLKLNRMN